MYREGKYANCQSYLRDPCRFVRSPAGITSPGGDSNSVIRILLDGVSAVSDDEVQRLGVEVMPDCIDVIVMCS